jgi:hypothetical protein
VAQPQGPAECKGEVPRSQGRREALRVWERRWPDCVG